MGREGLQLVRGKGGSAADAWGGVELVDVGRGGCSTSVLLPARNYSCGFQFQIQPDLEEAVNKLSLNAVLA